MSSTLRQWQQRARSLRTETHALVLACRDPRVPWPAKLLVAGIVAYALSPIDLVPDFIPVLGYLDDLVLIPLGIRVAIRLIPPAILEEHRARARSVADTDRPSVVGAVLVILGWAIALAVFVWVARRWFPSD